MARGKIANLSGVQLVENDHGISQAGSWEPNEELQEAIARSYTGEPPSYSFRCELDEVGSMRSQLQRNAAAIPAIDGQRLGVRIDVDEDPEDGTALVTFAGIKRREGVGRKAGNGDSAPTPASVPARRGRPRKATR